MRVLMAGVLCILGAVGAPAAAQDMVSAANPGGIVQALRDAGHSATLDVDDYGDPIITTKFGDYDGSIYFYGCDKDQHDDCTSVQFRAGFDRKTAMPLERVNKVVKQYRYAAMWIDEDGDPWVNFDVLTGGGIPKPVFMLAYDAYSDGLGTLAEAVFEDESAAAN